MLLVELLKKADQGYSDIGGLSDYYDSTTGELNVEAGGDLLAKFVVTELIETFEPEASDESQINQAIGLIRNADYALQDVWRALRG